MDEKTSMLDRELFESLYHRYFRKVFCFIYRHTRENRETEDLVHDVFLRFWRYRHSFSSDIPADAQLLTIAKQLVINRYKKELLKKEVLLEQGLFADAAYNHTEYLLRETEALDVFQKALEDLPPKRRAIFEKSRFEVMTYEEIAAEMGISKNTVESQMVKALKFLKERLRHLSYFTALLIP